MIKAYCYGVFADTMTDEEFYEVEEGTARVPRGMGGELLRCLGACWK